jgi:phenylacetic acid degradation operon negative regulatory protein
MSEQSDASAPQPVDDLDARPGSATSLLRTIVGATFRQHGGWMPTAAVIALLGEVGVAQAPARTAVHRVKSRGLLVAERRDTRAGYRLAAHAEALLERGDRRIHEPRTMPSDDPQWCLVAFRIPEEQRDARHQLRRRLSWIGAGTVTPALWITPAFLRDDVAGIVRELRLERHVTVFTARDAAHDDALLPELVSQWWDLDAIRALHQRFIEGQPARDAGVADGRAAFSTWIRTLDAWRPIPYLDPGLPASLLPGDWPGHRSAELFLDARERARVSAETYVRALLDRS